MSAQYYLCSLFKNHPGRGMPSFRPEVVRRILIHELPGQGLLDYDAYFGGQLASDYWDPELWITECWNKLSPDRRIVIIESDVAMKAIEKACQSSRDNIFKTKEAMIFSVRAKRSADTSAASSVKGPREDNGDAKNMKIAAIILLKPGLPQKYRRFVISIELSHFLLGHALPPAAKGYRLRISKLPEWTRAYLGALCLMYPPGQLIKESLRTAFDFENMKCVAENFIESLCPRWTAFINPYPTHYIEVVRKASLKKGTGEFTGQLKEVYLPKSFYYQEDYEIYEFVESVTWNKTTVAYQAMANKTRDPGKATQSLTGRRFFCKAWWYHNDDPAKDEEGTVFSIGWPLELWSGIKAGIHFLPYERLCEMLPDIAGSPENG